MTEQPKVKRARRATPNQSVKEKNQAISSIKRCRKCMRDLHIRNFYSATNNVLDSDGKMSVCSECCNELYNYYFSINRDMRRALDMACRDLDVVYKESAVDATVTHCETIASEGKELLVFGIYKTKIGFERSNTDLRYQYGSDIVSELDISELDFLSEEDTTERLIQNWGNIEDLNDLRYLENEYVDWCTRVNVDTKPMEILIRRICKVQLAIRKKESKSPPESTKDEDKTLQDLMNSAALKPIQESAAMATETNTIGIWIKKFEEEQPIPEPDEEFRDVDGIIKYIRVWFLGHMCKMLGIENKYSREYEEELDKYTVEITGDEMSDGDVSGNA